jgi:hypothetical protein
MSIFTLTTDYYSLLVPFDIWKCEILPALVSISKSVSVIQGSLEILNEF